MKVNRSVLKAKLSEVGLLLIFKALIEVAYILYVNPRFEYYGFSLQLNAVKLLESYLFLIVLFPFLPARGHKPSAVGTKLLFILMVVPTLSLYALKNESRVFLYLFVAGFWLTLLTIQILPTIRVERIKNSASALFLGLGIVSVLVYAVLIKFNGIPTLDALNFNVVYEIRRAFKLGPRIMGYLVPWQANIINCFLIGLAWYKRRYFSLLAVLGLQLLLFLITGHKSFLLAPALVLFLVYAIQRQHVLKLSLRALIVIVLFSLTFYVTGWSEWPASLVINRVLFLPAQNYFYYYDFFSRNQLMYLSNSHLNPFLESPYNMRVTHMMGMLYYGNPDMGANTGYLADAYMNFGSLGVLLFSLIFGVLLLVMDSIVKNTDPVVAIAAMAIPIYKLVDGALFTTLGTQGLLLSMLVAWLYTKRTKRRSKEVEARSYT